MCVNNLPKVVIWKLKIASRSHDLLSLRSRALTITPSLISDSLEWNGDFILMYGRRDICLSGVVRNVDFKNFFCCIIALWRVTQIYWSAIDVDKYVRACVYVVCVQGWWKGEALPYQTWGPTVHHWLSRVWVYEWAGGILQEESTLQEGETALCCHRANASTAWKGMLFFFGWNLL